MKTITGPRTGIEQDKGLIDWFVLYLFFVLYDSIPISSSICEIYICIH